MNVRFRDVLLLSDPWIQFSCWVGLSKTLILTISSKYLWKDISISHQGIYTCRTMQKCATFFSSSLLLDLNTDSFVTNNNSLSCSYYLFVFILNCFFMKVSAYWLFCMWISNLLWDIKPCFFFFLRQTQFFGSVSQEKSKLLWHLVVTPWNQGIIIHAHWSWLYLISMKF